MFTNNLISGPLSKEANLPKITVTKEGSLSPEYLNNTEVILEEGALFVAVNCIFEGCKFTVTGNLDPRSIISGCTFFNCDTSQLQQAISGFSVGS